MTDEQHNSNTSAEFDLDAFFADQTPQAKADANKRREGGRDNHSESATAPSPQKEAAAARTVEKAPDRGSGIGAIKGKLSAKTNPGVRPDKVVSKRATKFTNYLAIEIKRSMQRRANTTSRNSAFRSLPIDASGHEIRGGGAAQTQSPKKMLILGVILVVGVVIGLILLFSLVGKVGTVGSARHVFATTEAQSRELIDGSTPLLVNYLELGPDDALTSITKELNLKAFTSSTYTNDTIDSTATGKEIIGANDSRSADDYAPFFTGGYGVYTPEQIEELFSGSWVLDLNKGDMGTILKLKYVNLAAKSVDDEMAHLRSLQTLDAKGVKVVADGKDVYGNRVLEGTKTINKKVYYWRVGACSFSELYKQAVPDNAVYITCIVATYEFYKGDIITAS